jgi:hypothetical protein
MVQKSSQEIDIPWALIEGIQSFPLQRSVEHCGNTFDVSPFDFYTVCPRCGTRIKVRACSGITEIEDVFDAVFAWMNQPGAQVLVRRRQQEIAADAEES